MQVGRSCLCAAKTLLPQARLRIFAFDPGARAAEWVLARRCFFNNGQEVQMRFVSRVIATLVLATALFHVDRTLAATNCGFITIEQCRATASGMGGFCVPNQFYNPRRPAKDARKQREVRAYDMPFDPYPWCAQYMDGDK
jgi:hypothetical protein